MKEEESHSEESREQPSHPPAPKVKMSLRDFALRKKKQREEEMTKNVQDTPSLPGVDLSFGGGEVGGGPNGIKENPMGQVDEESRNEKTVELKEDLVDSYQGVSTSSRNIVKDEVVDIPGASAIKPTTINGIYHPQPSSSPPLGPLSSLLATRLHTTVTAQPCQEEDGEIGEILDTPLQQPSSLPAAPPAMNRLGSMTTPIPGTITPLPRGPTSKRTDFAFSRSASSSSQVRHSPPTHPKSYNNASPPYRQQGFSGSTPPPIARGTGVPPTAPRALRQYMSSNRPTPTTPTVMTSSSSYPPTTSNNNSSTIPTSSTPITPTTTTGGRFPPYIPRGPSADRDKVRDIDQTQYANPLSRRDSREGGHHAWGR